MEQQDFEKVKRIKRISRDLAEVKATKIIDPKNNYNRKKEKNSWKRGILDNANSDKDY